MNALHHVITKISTDPRLANVPRPIIDVVAELALTTLVDGLTIVGKGDSCLDADVCCLDDLRVCEGCEAISGDVREYGEVNLCSACIEAEERCPKSPTGKHVIEGRDIAVHALDFDPESSLRCIHCQPKATAVHLEKTDARCEGEGCEAPAAWMIDAVFYCDPCRESLAPKAESTTERESEVESLTGACHASPTGKHSFVPDGAVERCKHCRPSPSDAP